MTGSPMEIDMTKAKSPLNNKEKDALNKLMGVAYRPDGGMCTVWSKKDYFQMITMTDSGESQQSGMKLAANFKHDEVNTAMWDSTGQSFWVAKGGAPGHIMVHGFTPNGASSHQLLAHAQNVNCLSRDPNGRFMVSGGGDGIVAVWDLSSMACTQTFSNASNEVSSLSVNHDGSLLAWCSDYNEKPENTFTIASISGQTVIGTPAVAGAVMSVKWHPKKNVVAVAVKEKEEEQRTTGHMYDRDRDRDRDRERDRDRARPIQFLTIPES